MQTDHRRQLGNMKSFDAQHRYHQRSGEEHEVSREFHKANRRGGGKKKKGKRKDGEEEEFHTPFIDTHSETTSHHSYAPHHKPQFHHHHVHSGNKKGGSASLAELEQQLARERSERHKLEERVRSLTDRNDDLIEKIRRSEFALINSTPISSSHSGDRGKKQFGGFSFLKSIPLLQSLSEAQLSKLSGRLETRQYEVSSR